MLTAFAGAGAGLSAIWLWAFMLCYYTIVKIKKRLIDVADVVFVGFLWVGVSFKNTAQKFIKSFFPRHSLPALI